MSAADVLALVAPQYATDARASSALTLAVARMGGLLDAVAAGSQESAVAYLAAHILTLADRGAASSTSGLGIVGPITSVSTGDLSIGAGSQFGMTRLGYAALASTPYGLELLAIIENGPASSGFWAV